LALPLPLLLFRQCVVIQTQLKPAEEAQTTDSRLVGGWSEDCNVRGGLGEGGKIVGGLRAEKPGVYGGGQGKTGSGSQQMK